MMAQSDPLPECKILVTGDVVVDHCIYEGRQRRSGSNIRLGTIERSTRGGGGLLYDLLAKVGKKGQRLSVSFGFNARRINASAADGYCVMRPFQKLPGRSDEKSPDKVWRMAEALGFSADGTNLHSQASNQQTLNEDHRVVVIDDAGLSFRRWPVQAAWPRFLVDDSRSLPEWLVLKMSGPVTSGDLWHTIASGETQDKQPRKIRDCTELLRRTIAVISVNDLRIEPIHVSGDLSWERIALDLVQELCGNASLSSLQSLRFVIVSLGTDGAIVVEFPQDSVPQFQLIFDPGRLEGDFAANFEGTLFGYQTCLTAAIVSRMADISHSDRHAIERLKQGVTTGLCTMRRFLVSGHGPVEKTSGVSAPGFPHALLADEVLSATHDWSYGSVAIPPGQSQSPNWTIIAGTSSGKKTPVLWGLARRVSQHGLRQLQQTPYLQFGKLFSVERSEIESLRMLRQLLIRYDHDEEADKPLSIAAFGPPGAGKSFGVKQLARGVFGKDVPLLEFNLAQFRDAGELHGLLHQVRDQVLLGKLPVVFWDEFDSQDLNWLQYLLAPMQDGAFQEGQITHPIGKCVFVFAGGTRSRFQDFGEPPEALIKTKYTPRFDEWQEHFKAKKGPDFKSRLAGYINVLGPNPSKNTHDVTYPVRRALLMRVHLGVGPYEPLRIDRGLLAGFLEIDEYRHGARSVVKIAEQVRLASRTGEFTQSDLPSFNQLELHVNAEKFLKLVERKT